MAQYLGNAAQRGVLGLAGVPRVERVSVRVVTDAYHHAFERAGKVGEVDVERVSFALAPGAMPMTLKNEWGLALYVESLRGKETRRILIDFGFTAETLNHNLKLLSIDCGALDALVLSHGHYDHFGGMAGFLKAQRRKLKQKLPLYLGGEECFCVREAGVGAAAGSFGALDRKAISAAKLKVVTTEKPRPIAGHAFSTGWIPAESFERVLSPTRMKVGMSKGAGCAAGKLPQEKRSADVIPDDFQHEHATCFHVEGRGLVVITSCGHRGVVNSVKQAVKVSGVQKVHAVLGGFHLAPHPPEYVDQTVSALKEIAPDYVIPMHCTGEAFLAAAQREMPSKVIRSSTGSRYTFGAHVD
jgi:7,8-dihydropterin-6-yl-methyl-4-(beta-D-ribofuranosyl)aminobenzene 5'-phosphate synthase